MFAVLAYLLAFQFSAFAGDDPDRKRTVPEGQTVYTGPDVRVGAIYEAFLIRFQDRQLPFLSPSRFKVEYLEGALKCRNGDQYRIGSDATGSWHKVSFEVLAVRESAIEEPPGSGNWGWAKTFDCDIKSLKLAD